MAEGDSERDVLARTGAEIKQVRPVGMTEPHVQRAIARHIRIVQDADEHVIRRISEGSATNAGRSTLVLSEGPILKLPCWT